jgi:glycerol-3-phosphate dehydrogenase (NAD(P)+)
VGFVGLGNMGTTIANLIAQNGYVVIGWEYDRAVVREINKRHTNARYLRKIKLARSLTATDTLSDAFSSTGIVFIALPTVFIRQTLAAAAVKIPKDTIVVNLSKGIDTETAETSFQIVSRLFPENRCVLLSGPSIANEIARHMPTVVTLAGASEEAVRTAARILDNEYFRTSISSDVTGVELGGILKNIYAIGLGIFDGSRVESVNFRSVYLTLALAEMARFGVRQGARPETFAYIAGLGDLFATSMSRHSHNRRMGELLAKGSSIDGVRRKMKVLPEGYTTLRSVLKTARRLNIPLPVARDLNAVIEGRMNTRTFIQSVISRERMAYESDSRY